VCGTQAPATFSNNVIVMKMHNLHRTSKEKEKDSDLESDEEDSSSDEEEDEEKKPKMSAALIKHHGSVNRIRQTKFADKNFSASWSETGKVYIYDITSQLQAVDDPSLLKEYEEKNQSELTKPVFTFRGHTDEGYGIDWCMTESGVLATGDCKKNIHIWKPTDDGSWLVNQRPLTGHNNSVEDIQWSPNERNVLATCSVDKSIRIWDTRAAPNSACMLTCDNAHESDINVISWNKTDPLIASGGDDGVLNVWDLRQFQSKKPVATFKHHTNHITTVEWNPNDSTVLATGGDDDQIALWDLAVERDDTQKMDDATINKLPPQLLFIHQGQKEIKELHWHPQLPGVLLSTASTGFNIFRTISV
jgi:ribosome assembly protein RRB1